VLPVRSHRVVYTFNRKRVRVLRVLHQAMEVGGRL
jgi:plasmid stabilization system protein ParE